MHPRRDDSKKNEGVTRPNVARRGARAGAPMLRGRGGYASSHQNIISRRGHTSAYGHSRGNYTLPTQQRPQNTQWQASEWMQPMRQPAYPQFAFGSLPPLNYATSVPPSFGFVPGGLTATPGNYYGQFQMAMQDEDIEMGQATEPMMVAEPRREMHRREEGQYRQDAWNQAKNKDKGKGKQRALTPEPSEEDAWNEAREEARSGGWHAPKPYQDERRQGVSSSASTSSSRQGGVSQPTSSRELQIVFRDDDIIDPDHERKVLEQYRAMRDARLCEEEGRRRIEELERTIREASRELNELKARKHGRSPSQDEQKKRARTDERSMDE